MRKVLKRNGTFVGPLQREVSCKMDTLSKVVQVSLGQTLDKANGLVVQTCSRKAVGNRAKLYSWRAPEVESINKGESCKPYEFEVKFGLATTLKANLIVGATSFTGNTYDSYTLYEQIEQATILMQNFGVRPETIYADLGYRGVGIDYSSNQIKHRGKVKRLTDEERRLLKHRQAIESIIGQFNADHRLNRCHLKSAQGDVIHTVQCVA